MIVEGQLHGGIVQGVAQALFEGASYDEDGNCKNPSFLDYLVPSPTEVPSIKTGFTTTPSTSNPLGVKGVGEAGTIGQRRCGDQCRLRRLVPYGVTDIEMPASPSGCGSHPIAKANGGAA